MGAVAAYTYGEHTVVFVGTRSGQLKKVGREDRRMDERKLLVDVADGEILAAVLCLKLSLDLSCAAFLAFHRNGCRVFESWCLLC